jgi:hypothetical protein
LLYCDNLPHLTHINAPHTYRVHCDNSPIADYNNDLYLSYINTRRKIIMESINKSRNYEHGILSIIVGYL